MINLDYLPQPLGIKIKISKSKTIYPYTLGLVKSPFIAIEPVGNIYTLDSLYKDKLKLQILRRKPRDLFDLWYIASILNRSLDIKEEWKYPEKILLDDLNIFLPEDKRKLLKLFKR